MKILPTLKLGVLVIGANALASCTTQQAQQADTWAIDLTNAVCAVADSQPAGQPWVELVCTTLQAGEGIASVVIPIVGGDAGAQASTPVASVKTVRIRVAPESVPAILAMSKKVKP